MKKIALLAVLAFAITCGLTACKKAENETSSPAASTPAASASHKPMPDYIDIVADDSDAAVSDEPVCGGWQDSADGVITKEAQEAFDKAMAAYTDDNKVYTPLSLLGSQVVAGMNYAYLCEGKDADAASDVAAATYKVVIYADLDGNATVSSIEEYTP